MKVLQVSSFNAGLQREKEWLTKLEGEMKAIQQAIDGFVALEDSLKGQGGNALRAFYNDCHLPFILFFQGFQSTFQEILTSMKASLNQLEPSDAGYIQQSFLEGEVENGLTEISTITGNLTDEANSIMDTVADIVSLPHLNDSEVQSEIKNAKKKRDTTVTDLEAFDTNQTAALEVAAVGINSLKSWLSDIEFLMAEGLAGVDFPQEEWKQAQSGTLIGKFYNNYQADLLANNPRVTGNDVDVSSPNNAETSGEGIFDDMGYAFLSAMGLSGKDWLEVPIKAASSLMTFSHSGYAASKEILLAKQGFGIVRETKVTAQGKTRVVLKVNRPELDDVKKKTYTGANATNYTKIFKRVDIATNVKEAFKYAGNKVGYWGIGLTAAGNVLHGIGKKPGREIAGDVVSDVGVAAASWAAGAAAGAKFGAAAGVFFGGPAGVAVGAGVGMAAGVVTTAMLNGIKIFDADKDGKKDSVRDIVKTGVSKLVGFFG